MLLTEKSKNTAKCKFSAKNITQLPAFFVDLTFYSIGIRQTDIFVRNEKQFGLFPNNNTYTSKSDSSTKFDAYFYIYTY